MASPKYSFVPLDKYSLEHNIPHQKLIDEISNGSRRGRLQNNTWYIEASTDNTQLTKSTANALSYSETTALICAAANLYARKIRNDIEPRNTNIFKSSAKEYGIDIKSIHKESSQAMTRLTVRDCAIGLAAIIGLVTLFGIVADYESLGFIQESNISILLMCFVAIAAFDFIYTQMAKRRARKILKSVSDVNKNMDDEESTISVMVSGGFSPFVGSGYDISGWTFTVDLAKADDTSREVQSVTIDELYDETTQRLLKSGIKNISISDEIFVDGRDVRNYQQLLPNGDFSQPIGHLSNEASEELLKNSSHHFRNYKTIRVFLWNGQLILSFFHRYIITGSSLYVETRIFMLPPLNEKLMNIDNMPSTTSFAELRNDVFFSLVKAPFIWIPVIYRAVAYLFGGLWSEIFNTKIRTVKREIKHNKRYNYGWPNSLREYWASDSFARYFQLVDQDYTVKLVKEALLASLKDALENRNISTDDFSDAVTKIFNEGVIVNGGQIKAENIAVGKGAKALASNILGGKSGSKSTVSSAVREV